MPLCGETHQQRIVVRSLDAESLWLAPISSKPDGFVQTDCRLACDIDSKVDAASTACGGMTNACFDQATTYGSAAKLGRDHNAPESCFMPGRRKLWTKNGRCANEPGPMERAKRNP